MPGNDAIELEGAVTAVLPAGRYRLRLRNGHELVARVIRRRQSEFERVGVGDRLAVAASPSDMSQALVEKILERNT